MSAAERPAPAAWGWLTSRLGRISAIADVTEKRPSLGVNVDSLDGVRGLAVLIVLAAHTNAFHMDRHGSAGVWLFFTLSAFLLTMPFARDPDRIRREGALRHYFSRRLRRVLPAYYVVIVILMLRGGWGVEDFLRHVFFLRGDGLLWTIPQVLLFYLVLPVLVGIQAVWPTRSLLATVLMLTGVAAAAHVWLDRSVLSMDGGTTTRPFFLGIFVTGMVFAYLAESPRVKQWVHRPGVARLLGGVGAVAWALLLLTAQHFHEAAASVVPVLDRLAAPMAWQSPWIFGWLGSVLIFVSVASPRSVVARLLSAWPLRLVGIVSYSLYLVHVTVIQKLHQLGLESGTGLFLATFAVSYGISVALYGLVERPFLYPTGLPSAQRRAPEPVISSAPAKEVTDERSRS